MVRGKWKLQLKVNCNIILRNRFTVFKEKFVNVNEVLDSKLSLRELAWLFFNLR